MSQWNIKASTLFVLSCMVIFMLLIVILPEVDLPDTAFHQGTAPLVVHARGTAHSRCGCRSLDLPVA